MAAIADKSFTRFAHSSQSHPLICGVHEQRERDFSFLIQQVEDHVSILENHRQQLASELHVLREYSWGLHRESSRCHILLSPADRLPRFVPLRAVTVVDSVIALTGSAFNNIRCALLNAMMARALTAGLGVRAPVLLMFIFLTFAASQRPRTFIESIGERCFLSHMGNSTG
ncbi:hypothetical protein N7478_003774 [Penicillium angulare]|uniref:uncharacterized protein n=1 Tax=Penicillium angulare TaxID=116970 RepID=UPI002541D3EB|nr:uncharacterized protein N7478_003774 [Penicillium angulare]KAJ5288088.1 hypothetical protein N7478_003774 [Penicillium angulare]